MINPQVCSLPDAQQILINAAQPVTGETIPSGQALGRVLYEDIMTPHAFPDTRRSAVDGYAVANIDAERFHICETLGAGQISSCQLTNGDAAAVMTGATVPEGSVAVIRVEDCEVEEETLVLKKQPENGENINRVGEETGADQTVLTRGTRLDPIKHSVLCCLGVAEVKVFQLPRIGILVTGDEVLQLGDQHQPGSVYDSNRHFLASCLAQLGLTAKVIGPVKDDEKTIKDSVNLLAEQCDLVISSGGVSMGKYDFIRPLLHSSGFDVLINRTGIKPGRPLIVARNAKALFFGMPGYPAACLVNFFYYLLPTVKKLMGMTDTLPVTRRIRIGTDLKGRKGRWDIIRARVEQSDDTESAHPLDSQLTSHFLNFAMSDGLIMLDADTDRAMTGELVNLLDFRLQYSDKAVWS